MWETRLRHVESTGTKCHGAQLKIISRFGKSIYTFHELRA